jgi:hypothetical protein
MTAFMRHPSVRAASPWLLAALLSVALAACAQGAGANTSTNPVEAGRRYAQCMRDNGVPDFPDPDADGRFRGIGHEKEDTPTYKAAMETCRDKLPGGGGH